MASPSSPQRLPPHLLQRARVLASRDEILDVLPQGCVFAEVGVAFGDFTRLILDRCRPRLFLALDLFDIERYPVVWGRPVTSWLGDRSHEHFYAERFAADIAAGRMKMLKGNAYDQIVRLDDDSVDVFYIDAGHGYEEVRDQLSVARLKLKSDGFIVMNDYISVDSASPEPSHYGVIHATHEFMIEHDYEMLFLALHPQMFCDVVLRRRGA